MEGKVPLEAGSFLVIGGGLVGLEAADFLSAREKRVSLVEVLEEVGTKLDPLPRAMLMKRLHGKGVQIHTRTRVLGIEPEFAEVEEDGKTFRIQADMVVVAVGVQPNRELADQLEGGGLEVHLVGDVAEPRGAGEAILEGLEIGARI
jgi:NADPH-dependent 2,4-dienoyl-CoA reductase/sulfur reductase-like enzyme